jgi:putative ABC transport system permease protein
VGQHLRRYGETHEVVGVVRDGRYLSLASDENGDTFAFFPAAQNYTAQRMLHVRTAGPAAPLIQQLRREVSALDPDIALEMPAPLDHLIGFQLFPQRFAAVLIGLFGVVGLLLAGLGVYGVLAYHVAQRRHELGIRLALGAQGADLTRLIVLRGLAVTGIGLGIGLALAAAGTRLLTSLLHGVSPLDPVTFAGVILLLAAVALLAGLLPARRATRIAPAEVLREG